MSVSKPSDYAPTKKKVHPETYFARMGLGKPNHLGGKHQDAYKDFAQSFGKAQGFCLPIGLHDRRAGTVDPRSDRAAKEKESASVFELRA